MGNSLQDQLLKAGLVNEQKSRQVRTAKHKQIGQTGVGKGEATDENRRRAQQAADEKARRDRELNLQHQEEARCKAQASELRQLIHAHRVPRREGNVAYNFQDGASLKRVYVTAEQQRRLAGGSLALVRQDLGYEVVPAEIADRILSRDARLVLVYNRVAEANGGDDGGYGDYRVPDDLLW